MKRSEVLYLGLTMLLLLDLVLYLVYNISFRGILIDKAIFWIWIIWTPIFVFRRLKLGFIKLYGFLLILLTLISLLPMGIPFLTVLAYSVTVEDRFVVDERLEIQETNQSVVGIPYVAVLEKKYIFEQEIAKTDFEYEVRGSIYRTKDLMSIKKLFENELIIKFEMEFPNGTIEKNIKKAHNTKKENDE